MSIKITDMAFGEFLDRMVSGQSNPFAANLNEAPLLKSTFASTVDVRNSVVANVPFIPQERHIA